MRFYPLIRALLFQLDPERAHDLTLNAVRFAGNILPVKTFIERVYHAAPRPLQVFGLNFSNPIGLAAGYDKDGLGWRGLATLGFGHIEVGTVTPKPQVGNPQPRLFRIPDNKALINRMGFPGMGADFVLQQISSPRPKDLILGVNIGKNKDTPLETAVEDYLYLVRLFVNNTDYLAINVSSPNTVGLRALQEKQVLNSLLRQLTAERDQLTHVLAHKTPILVKLSPDLTDLQLDNALDVLLANQIDGVIATNTTLSREGLNTPLASETGGLSGKPLFERSLGMVQKIYLYTSGKLPIIGVGGISDGTGVQRMMDAGAKLVQLYTGLLYEGPGIVKHILHNI